MKSILFVDDDALTRDSVQKLLKRFGFVVETADSIDAAYLRAEQAAFSLILVDLLVGRENGTNLVRQLRALGIMAPIVIYSAHDSEYYQTGALDAGADDYILKTISIPLLISRLHAHIRREERRNGRNTPGARRRVAIGQCVLDRGAHVLEVGEKILKLTEKETRIVDLLASDPSRIFPQREILEKVCGRDYLMSEDALQAILGRLRKKLEKECDLKGLIENQHGRGFRLVERVAAEMA
jgi:DNA-binding response OmpR family regulator